MVFGNHDRPASPSTTHGSLTYDTQDDAHDYTRLRLQQQLEKDLLGAHSDMSINLDSTMNIMEGAAAMSTRRLDDILPSTPQGLDSNMINAHFKDFSTIGVGVRQRLFPDLVSNENEDSIEFGRAGDDHTRSDKPSILPRLNDKGRLSVPGNGIGLPKRQGHSPGASRMRYHASVADDSMDTITRPLNTLGASRLRTESRRSKEELTGTREQQVREKLEAASRKENMPFQRGGSATPPIIPQQLQKKERVTSAFLNTERLFHDFGFSQDASGFSDARSASPPAAKNPRIRAASKPSVPNYTANSIKLPDLTNISDLVSSVNHGEPSSRKAQHKQIASIPVPQDERMLLAALKQLQEKVAALEADKAHEKARVVTLEKDYEETRNLYEIEVNGRRQLEAELNTRKRADSALGGEIESDQGSIRWNDEKEKMRKQHKSELKKMENHLAAYRQRLSTIEEAQTKLKAELGKVTEEKDAAISALAKNAHDAAQFEELLQQNKEYAHENDVYAQEIERLTQIIEAMEKEFGRERKLYNDKVNRYREKLSRAGGMTKEATIAAHDARQLVLDMQRNLTITTTRTLPGDIVRPGAPEPGSQPPPHVAQQSRRTSRSQRQQQQQEPEADTSNADERVQQQVDAELKKMFKQTASTTRTKTTTIRTQSKNRVKRSRHVAEEYSESEGEEQEQPVQEVSYHAVNDTTFTAPSISDSRVERENNGEVIPEHTLHSFIESDGIAALRDQIEQERRKFEDNLARQREEQDMEARRAQMHAERLARHAAEQQKQAAANNKRVFIYSEKDNETTVTDHDENEAPHHNLRTSMIVNETDDVNDQHFENILPENQRAAATTAQYVQQQQQQHNQQRHQQRRNTQDSYNDHVQEVIDRLGVHKQDLCTICRRKSAIGQCNSKGHSGTIVNESAVENPEMIPECVPVSKRMPEQEVPWEGDITMRPSQPPKYALDKVVKQMQDELEHMRLDYKKVEAEFLSLDPSLGKRKRKALTLKLNGMVEEMDKKADQIYSLFDVAEAVHESDSEVSVGHNNGAGGSAESGSGGGTVRRRSERGGRVLI